MYSLRILARFRVPPRGPFRRLPAPFFGLRQSPAALPLEKREFPFQFPVPGQPPSIQTGRPHGAARFHLVPAIPKTALSRQHRNLAEHVIGLLSLRPWPDLPQSGHIDQKPVSRQEKKLALGRCVPPPRITRPHFARRLPVLAEQRIHNSRFPRPGRTDQSGRLARLHLSGNLSQPQSGPGAHSQYTRPQLFPSRSRALLEIGAQIGLIQYHHRPSTTLSRHHQVTLQPPRVVIVIESADNEQHVHVRRQHLFARRTPRLFSREPGAPRQDLDDDLLPVQPHPVTHTRSDRSPRPETSAERGCHFAALGPDHILLADA